MEQWPIFDKAVLEDLNHRSAQAHLSTGLHMLAMAFLVGAINMAAIDTQATLWGRMITMNLIIAYGLVVAYLAKGIYLEIKRSAIGSPEEDRELSGSPRRTTLALCFMTVTLIWIAMRGMGPAFMNFMILTGTGLIALSASEHCNDKPRPIQSFLVMGAAGITLSLPLAFILPEWPIGGPIAMYAIMIIMIMLDMQIEQTKISWGGQPTDHQTRVMRLVVAFLLVIMAAIVQRTYVRYQQQ